MPPGIGQHKRGFVLGQSHLTIAKRYKKSPTKIPAVLSSFFLESCCSTGRSRLLHNRWLQKPLLFLRKTTDYRPTVNQDVSWKPVVGHITHDNWVNGEERCSADHVPVIMTTPDHTCVPLGLSVLAKTYAVMPTQLGLIVGYKIQLKTLQRCFWMLHNARVSRWN